MSLVELIAEKRNGSFKPFFLDTKGETFEEELLKLFHRGEWRSVIELRDRFSRKEMNRTLWAWPTFQSLDNLRKVLVRHRCQRVLSIGCGSGLLEWLLQSSSGIPVAGLERDRSWWTSAYSPTTFIELSFIQPDEEINGDLLNRAAANATGSTKKYSSERTYHFALLFCYFNDKEAFDAYVRAFDGPLIILVGPEACSGTVTDPQPLNPQFEKSETHFWTIETIINIDSFNYMAVYRRIQRGTGVSKVAG